MICWYKKTIDLFIDRQLILRSWLFHHFHQFAKLNAENVNFTTIPVTKSYDCHFFMFANEYIRENFDDQVSTQQSIPTEIIILF